MALDATIGGANADSYVTLVEAAAYFGATQAPMWATATDPDRESALRRAAIWLDGTYRKRWGGVRANGRAQALDWPRSGATDRDGYSVDLATIPPEVKRAQCEAALVELVSPRSLSPQVTMAGVVTSEKVGPIGITYAGAGDLADTMPVLTSVEQILSGLVLMYDTYYPAALVV